MGTTLLAQSVRHLTNFSAFSCRTISSIKLNVSTVRNYATAIKGRLYTDKHEWVEVIENIGTVGISHYAQDSLGDVVYAQLPEVGTEICQHDEVGALESVKAASELYSPISGKVVQINTDVVDTPSIINKDCYIKGWLFKVAMSKADIELKDLMTEESYNHFLKTAAQQ